MKIKPQAHLFPVDHVNLLGVLYRLKTKTSFLSLWQCAEFFTTAGSSYIYWLLNSAFFKQNTKLTFIIINYSYYCNSQLA